MGITDIFSIPFLICLAICILLVGCSSIYFYQRILQQDHKISSMVSLISSMAEERHVNSRGGSSETITQPSQVQVNPIKETRITVSDDESDSDSTDSSSDGDNSEYSADTDTNETDEKEIITINLGESLFELDEFEEEEHTKEKEQEEEEHGDDDEEEHGDDDEEEHGDDDEEEHDNEEEEHIDLEFELDEPDDTTTVIDLGGDTKTIHLLEPFEITAVFKTNNNSVEDLKNNYKKLSIQKLREIAQTQGHEDIAKLKKTEILKLLGVE
jgi:hypothetical protein